MRVISSEAQDILNSGRFDVRCLLKVDVDGDVFAIWDDVGQITIDEVEYTGKAKYFTVQGSTSVKDNSVRNMDVTLTGVDASVVALIEGYVWHQRPILVQRALIALDEPTVLHLVPEFAGFLDQMIWRERGAGGQSTILFRCESAAREFSRSSARMRSDSDQRERDATDGSLRFATSTATTSIDWGRSPSAALKPEKPKGLAGLINKIF